MGKCITIKDLYNWAKENNAEDLEVVVQYRDEGGDYYGADEEIRMDVAYYNGHYSCVEYSKDYSNKDGYRKVVVL